MRKWARTAAALAVFTGSLLMAPQPALACSGPVLTLEEATTTATLILAGRVDSSPHEWAYELDVEEVFRGPSSETVVVGPAEPVEPAGAPICSHQLKVGDRVVIALRDPSDLGLFSSAVWYLLPDGSVGTVAPEPPAATHDELFALLRLLPDTGIVAVARPALPLGSVGVILLAAGVALGFRLRRQHRYGCDGIAAFPENHARSTENAIFMGRTHKGTPLRLTILHSVGWPTSSAPGQPRSRCRCGSAAGEVSDHVWTLQENAALQLAAGRGQITAPSELIGREAEQGAGSYPPSVAGHTPAQFNWSSSRTSPASPA